MLARRIVTALILISLVVAATLYLSTPVLSLTKNEKVTRVSARATRSLFNNGLDLAKVLHEAADLVGGNGGGHPVASGATIPLGKEKEFLEKVGSVIKFQLE